MRGRDEAARERGRAGLVPVALVLVASLVLGVDPGGALEVAQTTTTVVTPTTTVGPPDTLPQVEAEPEVEDLDRPARDVVDEEPPATDVDGSGDPEADEEATEPDEPAAQPDVPEAFGFAIEIHGGVRGLARTGHPVPVSVEIAAQRLIAGELRVVAVADGRTVTSARTIEVPGSSTKRFVIITPIAVGEFDDLTVELEVEGETVVSHEVVVAADRDSEIVGVMGLVAAPDSLPDGSDLAIDAGAAALVGLDVETLGAGVGALAVFDSIVVSAADLDSLAGREFEALSAWLTAGGHLMVDEVTGPVPRLPQPWQPSAGEPRAAGLGLVRLTGGAAKTGEWESILLPSPVDDASSAAGYDLRASTDAAAGLDAVLSEDAGFSLPSIIGILIVLGLYAVIVAPLSYVLLRRRGRTHRMWITVPGLAVVATLGVVLLGADLRDNTSAAHLTVVVIDGGVDIATTHVLLDSSEAGITLPRGWHGVVDAGDDDAVAARVEGDDDGATAGLDLPSGRYGRLTATGPTNADGLRVAATSDAQGRVEGRVVNESDIRLHDVAVLVGAYGQSFGSLDPGEEREFSLGGVHGYELRADAATILWESSRLADAAGWEAIYDDRGGVNSVPIGAVTAVGWTDELDAPVSTIDGETIRSGRTLLLSHETIVASGETNMATRLQMVRGPVGFGSLQATYQGIVGDVSGAERISVAVPRFAADISVWNGSRWQTIGTSGRETTRAFRVEDVVIDGMIHIRLDIDRRQIFEFANGRTLTVMLLDGGAEG